MMKRIIVLVLLVVCYCSTFARDYFVGGPGASDANPGTSAQPFATIQKAASVAVAGDIIKIRAGTYRETIVPANPGTTYQPDQGAIVVISGLNTADGGWSVHSGNIYRKSITLPVNGYSSVLSSNSTLLANQVFKDGVMQFEARWPKLNNLADLFDRYKVFRNRTQTTNWTATGLTDGSLPNIAGGWVGGKIFISGWFISQTQTITSHSGNTIGFQGASSDLRFQQFYYVTGKLGALTQEKEWHYESGTLYFWQQGGGSPTNVEYKARNWGFDLRGKSNITIVGLNFIGCEPMTGDTNSNSIILDGIKAQYTNHAVVQEEPDVIYRNAKQTGMKLIGSNCIIRNSEIKWTASSVIWLGTNGRAENNLITDINYEANYAAGVAYWERTGGQVTTRNTIARCGRSAIDYGGYIHHGEHLGMDISYNDIYYTLMLHADGGSLYGARMVNLTGTRIHHNWIHDNLAEDTPYAPHEVGIETGLYFDQVCGPTTIDHNVLWNNSETDLVNQQWDPQRPNAGTTRIINNTFLTDAGDSHSLTHSYLTSTPSPSDYQRNNIYRDDCSINWVPAGPGIGDVANALFEGVNPQFVGTGGSGLAYRLNANSPGINAGMVISGITDGHVGSAPDIGAYEYGGPAWVPGYVAQTTIPLPDTPPVVSITAPANNASFTQGFPIAISATASDVNGTVTKVEFFSGTTKLGEDLTGPYSFVWSNASVGAHILTAKATDNANNITTSTQVNITVSGNVAPTVSLTSPANNAQFITGTPITITAAASDANGTVTNVEFFNGTTKLGEDLTAPYSFAWTNAPAGTHVLTAKATDNGNNVTTSAAVTIIVSANAVPTVSITSPANNAQFTAGSPITINATAADPNGAVTKVEFFNGTTKLGEDATSPYSLAWNNASTGVHVLTAKVTDSGNTVVTSASVSITIVANTPPTVSITGPSNNAQFTVGAAVSITATASDANGSITKVEFFSGTTKLGEDLTSPYSFAWNNAAIGTHILTAKATDNANNVTTSAAVNITVVAANTPPTVSITGPSNNAQFIAGTAIALTATAADANGSITKVEFFSGTTKLGEDLTSPYSFAWNSAAIGTHILTAKATDNANNVTTSAAVNITVVAANTPPTVSITGPSNNAQFVAGTAIALTATAADATGSITKVEFFSGTTKLGEDLTSPYSFAWNNAAIGAHVLTAKATDNGNLVTTSIPVNITVVGVNAGPIVSITGPSNNAQFTTGAPISITATASDANGSITKIEFFSGATKLGEDLTLPYSFTWSDAPAGSHSISAIATDDQNTSITSAAINISVINPDHPIASAGPDISLTLPDNSVILTAAEAPDGSQLQFNWIQLQGPSTPIFNPTLNEIELTSLIEGTYVFELTVTDLNGLTSKDQVIVTVNSSLISLGTIPRSFSPNGDGQEDLWEWPNNELYENSLLTIFNPSGQKVYEAMSYNNTWDGTLEGQPLQAGQYQYVIRLKDSRVIKASLRIIY